MQAKKPLYLRINPRQNVIAERRTQIMPLQKALEFRFLLGLDRRLGFNLEVLSIH
jgi:hypothetical protein